MVWKQIFEQETMWWRSLRERVGWDSKCVHVGFRKCVDNRKFLLHHSQVTNISKMSKMQETIYKPLNYTLSKHTRTLVSLRCYSISFVFIFLFSGITILQALPYYEFQGTYSVQLETPVAVYIHFPYLLMAYLPLLAAGKKIIQLTHWHN